MRRIVIAVTAVVSALTLVGPRSVTAADPGAAPVVMQWTPQTATANGQPLRITLVGSNLGGVTEVFTTPVVTPRTIAVISDQAVVVTLPPNVTPGEYGIQLVSPAGSTLPGSIAVTVAPAALAGHSSDTGPKAVAVPAVSLEPAPVAVEPTPKAAGPALPATGARQAQPAIQMAGAGSGGTSPFVVFAVGIAVGGLLYALWGKEGRLQVARRRGFLAQLWARPLQRLRLARICLQCGRLHYIFHTRRELWKAGDFCSASCFVSDQEKDRDLASSETVLESRLRSLGGHSETEISLVAHAEKISA